MSKVQSEKKSHVSSTKKSEETTAPASVAHTHRPHAPSTAAVESAPATSSVLTQLRALQASMHLQGRLTKEERKPLLTVVNTTPTALITAMATASAAHGGAIAGAAFDPTAAKATLDRGQEAAAIGQWARDFEQIVADDDLRARSALSESALHLYGMLPKYVQTPEGAPLLGAYEEMRDVVRAARKHKGRKPKPALATAPVTPTTPATTPATTPVVAAAPPPPKGGPATS